MHLACNYIVINDSTLLCTEITGISMPQGETIFYDVSRGECGISTKSTIKTRKFKPLTYDISTNEIIITDERANNRNIGLLRVGMETIGEIRKIARHQNISMDEVIAGKVTTVPEPPPEAFSGSARIGSGGRVGLLQATLVSRDQSTKDEYGVSDVDTQYQKLLKHAQYVKNNAIKMGFGCVSINCYTKQGGLVGEVIEPYFIQAILFPRTVYVLRVEVDSELFYFLDCEAKDNQRSSGLIVKINDEKAFLSRQWAPGCTLVNLIGELESNHGRLSQESLAQYKNGGGRSGIAAVARYKHASQEVSNWVLIGLGKFRKG